MTTKPEPVAILVLGMLFFSVPSLHAQEVHSMGFFTGITVPYTWDEGIQKDPRYREKYRVRFAPFGFHYGIDYQGYGFTFDPSVFNTGQYFNVVNVAGGQVGERKIDLTYIHVPFGFKLHMIDLGFFKVSFVASMSGAFMLTGQESISHSDAILKFQLPVIPNLPPEYVPTFPGSTEIISPVVNNLTLLKASDYNRFQAYGAIGFRSDWDVTETLRLSMDIRGSYGLFEPRSSSYLTRVNNYEAIYDLPGARRDLLVLFTVGVSRTNEIDPKEKRAIVNKRKEKRPRKTSKYPWPGPRNIRPPKN
ncbi:outer membrane beta-barrel protein [Oscillatoria amoena NRMC-F 0135]|nr:outer membrane beta-barrel protein [Oscillatoria amoena NRMC-F 0135]